MLATFSRMTQAVREESSGAPANSGRRHGNLMGLFYSAQQAQPAAETQNANVIELAITASRMNSRHDLDMKLLAQELGVSYSWFRGIHLPRILA